MSDRDIKIKLPLLPILGIVFIVLKLTETITWSWWWVLAPFWVIPGIFLGIILVAALLATLDSRGR